MKGAESSPQHAPMGHKRSAPIKRIAAVLFLTLLLLIYILQPDWQQLPNLQVPGCLHRHKTIEQRVKRVLAKTPLIDGHDDLPILLRELYNNHIYNASFTKPFEEGGLRGHVDIPRLHAGHNGGAFWSVFWPCPANGTDYTDANYASTVQSTYQQIDLINRLKAVYPDVFAPHAGDSSTALASFQKGQLISPLGIEGLHQIGNSPSNLRVYHELGVRYATLTHNCGNRYADAALWENPLRKAPAVWKGVSSEGQKLVREMNRIGMIVDLSHTSVDTMVDVLGGNPDKWNGSSAPIIFSHSSAFSVCPHPRNVPDHVLKLVKERNSLVMVNFAPDFVSCKESGREDGLPDFDEDNATLEHVVDHIVYIGELIGYDHVGLGSDFDGIPTTPRGLDDVSKFPDLVAELLKRGVSDKDAGKVVGGNLLRVWKEVDEVAKKLKKEGVPVLEDDLEPLIEQVVTLDV